MQLQSILQWLAGLPPVLIYLLIGGGAAIENLFPPVPADTFVLAGAFLAARGPAQAWLVFLCTWVGNVALALLVYALARRWGHDFFNHRTGRWLLHPRQLEQIGRFYDRWGTPAIFVSRFLPAFRSIVPVFAGVSRVPVRRVALPMAGASALWYGALVIAGTQAGRNTEALLRAFRSVSGILLIIAVLLIAAAVWWWWKTRRERR